MKWYMWLLVIAVLFAAGWFTSDLLAKERARKAALALKNLPPGPIRVTPPGGTGTPGGSTI